MKYSQEQLELFESILMERSQEIEMQFEQTEEMAEPVAPDTAIGRLTRQDAMQQQQMTLETRRRLELQRTQIATALQRIRDGKFGFCVMCKQRITEERLEIVPESPLCVQCLEQRSKRTGRR